jgi:hypothetical protein
MSATKMALKAFMHRHYLPEAGLVKARNRESPNALKYPRNVCLWQIVLI